MRTVYDEWTRLQKVIIGRSFDLSNFNIDYKNKILYNYDKTISERHQHFSNIEYDGNRTTTDSLLDLVEGNLSGLKRIHDETNEDLDVLADICKQFGTFVVRPDILYPIETEWRHPMQVRDTIGKIGDTVFEVYTSSWDRMYENLNCRNILIDEFEEGARYISMPFPIYERKPTNTIDDIDIKNEISNKEIQSYDNQGQILGDTAAFMKCGKHIFHTHSNPKTKLKKQHSQISMTNNGREWWKREFPSHEFVEMNAYGHVDGKISILRPGLVLAWNKDHIPEIMKDWDVILIENKATYSGKQIKDLCEEKGVKNYPWHHLLGVSQETRFDANCLSLDENTVITSGYDKDLSDKLKKYNIEMIPWVNRWNFLWSGGAHCCSVDLAREGKLIDYFS